METEIRLLERVELPSDVAVKWESSIHRLFSEGVPLPLQPISDFLKDVLLNSPPGEWLIGKALGDLRQLLGNPVAAFWGDVLDGLSIGEAGMFFMTIYWVMLDPRALQAEREERQLFNAGLASEGVECALKLHRLVDWFSGHPAEFPAELERLLDDGQFTDNLNALLRNLTSIQWPSLAQDSPQQKASRRDESVFIVTNKPNKLGGRFIHYSGETTYYRAKVIYRGRDWDDPRLLTSDLGQRLLVENSLEKIASIPFFQPPAFLERPHTKPLRQGKKPAQSFLRALLDVLSEDDGAPEMNIERCDSLVNALFCEYGGLDRSEIANIMNAHYHRGAPASRI